MTCRRDALVLITPIKPLCADAHQGCIIVTYRAPDDPSYSFDGLYRGLSEQGLLIYPGLLLSISLPRSLLLPISFSRPLLKSISLSRPLLLSISLSSICPVITASPSTTI
jgi:hypothetical protein